MLHDRAVRCAAAQVTGVAGSQEEGDGLGAELFSVALPFVGDLLDGFVPRDALELALATLADAAHGVLQALGAVDARRLGQALGANTVELGAVLEVARGGAHDLAVAHVHVQIAALAALGAAGAGVDLGLRRRTLGAVRAAGLGATSCKKACRAKGRGSLDEISTGEVS